MGQSEHDPGAKGKPAWNAGRKLGAKRALKPQQVWAIRFWLDSKKRMRDRAMFDLAIDSKLRGCDIVKVKIGDLTLGGRVRSRAIVVQQKTKRPVQFELLDHAQASLKAWLERRGGAVTDYVFPSRIDHAKPISTRQYARLIHLKVADIDSARMLIRVEQGKGRKDRYVMLSPDLLDILRSWWRVKRPRGWLFPGQQPSEPLTARQLNRVVHAAATAAGLTERVSMHTLRHSFAIRTCRTAALGGHVARCTDCAHTAISYNSCRNRHCPKCQGAAARRWLAEREADLLPVPYFHVVFTLPAPIAAIAFTNKAAVYDLLFKAAAETVTTAAADPKHLGARVGLTAVLHTWGSALTHHPHVHMIVPGGGLLPDGSRWIACRPGFFLPVRVLSRLFRRLFLDGLLALHAAGRLAFFGKAVGLADRDAFAAHLAPLRKAEWVVYAKRPFGGPEAVLAYLSRYTHRVAISNSRLIRSDEEGVTFRWKDYRARGKAEGQGWIKTMTLKADEFIRRFLIHVLPSGFHRIRHYGLLGSR